MAALARNPVPYLPRPCLPSCSRSVHVPRVGIIQQTRLSGGRVINLCRILALGQCRHYGKQGRSWTAGVRKPERTPLCLFQHQSKLVCQGQLVALNPKSSGYWAVSPLCAGLGGRFPASPLFLPEEVPAWLKSARQRVQLAGNVLEFKQSLSLPAWERLGWGEEEAEKYTLNVENNGAVGVGGSDWPWYVLITSRNVTFAPAFHLEAQFMGFEPLKEKSLYSVPAGSRGEDLSGRWTRMTGLRLVLEPLAVGGTAEELAAAVGELRLGGRLGGFLLTHEALSALEGRAPRLREVYLNEVLSGAALRAQLALALRRKDGTKAESEACGVCCPRFVAVETKHGYLFGAVVYAPALPEAAFSDAPHQWSAGLPSELAAAAVNIAASPGDTLLDPCCGSGSILFEAHRRGIETFGSDLHLGILRLAAKNLEHFGIGTSRNWGPTSPVRGPHNPRTHLEEPRRPACSLTNTGNGQSGELTGIDLVSQKTADQVLAVEAEENGRHNKGGEVHTLPRLSEIATPFGTLIEFQPNEVSANGRGDVRRGKIDNLDHSEAPMTMKTLVPSILASVGTNEQLVELGTVSLAREDARKTHFLGDAIVTNLPFDRFIKVKEDMVVQVLRHLRGRARRYVFFAGLPLAETLHGMGYKVLAETPVCPRGKRYMVVAVLGSKKDSGNEPFVWQNKDELAYSSSMDEVMVELKAVPSCPLQYASIPLQKPYSYNYGCGVNIHHSEFVCPQICLLAYPRLRV